MSLVIREMQIKTTMRQPSHTCQNGYHQSINKQQMLLGKLDRYMQKNETRPPSYTTHNNKFKIDQRLKC